MTANEATTTALRGDVVLACPHVDPDEGLDDLHLFELAGPGAEAGIEVAATPKHKGDDVQGLMVRAKWILLCRSCGDGNARPIESASQHFALPRPIEATSLRSTE